MAQDGATTAQEKRQCRICQEEVGEADAAKASNSWAEELLEPCLCDGSVGLMHRSCLDRWRLGGHGFASQRCELCGFAFVQERRRAKRLESVVKVLIEVLVLSMPLLVIYALIGVATLPVVGLVSVFGLLGAWALFDAAMSAIGSSCGILGKALSELRAPELTKEEAELANSELGARLKRVSTGATQPEGAAPGTLQAWLKTMPSQKRLLFLLPVVLPHLLTAGLFLLRRLIGREGLERFGLWLAALGASYSALVIFTRMLAATLRPPWIVERDDHGLPVVRSITPHERELGRKKSN